MICVSPQPIYADRKFLVPGAGVEPARPEGQGILSPPRMPFRHPGTDEKAYLTKTYVARSTLASFVKAFVSDLLRPRCTDRLTYQQRGVGAFSWDELLR